MIIKNIEINCVIVFRLIVAGISLAISVYGIFIVKKAKQFENLELCIPEKNSGDLARTTEVIGVTIIMGYALLALSALVFQGFTVFLFMLLAVWEIYYWKQCTP